MAEPAIQKSKRKTHEIIRVLGSHELLTADHYSAGSAPSPIRGVLAMTICGGLLAGLLASIFFSVDIYATATARVQPAGRSKILQSAVSGKVTALLVSNGSAVEEGQVLVELDSTESNADQANVTVGLATRDAEIVRREAAIRAARNLPQEADVRMEFPSSVPADIIAREKEVLRANLAQLQTGLDVLEGRIAEAAGARRGLVQAVDDGGRLIRLLEEQERIRRELHAKGLETKVSLLDAQAALERETSLRTSRQSDIAKTDISIDSLRAQQRDLVAKFIADNAQAKSQAMEKRAELLNTLIKAEDKVGKTRLAAPISGIVQELALTTPGQVISAGEQLMVIVPRKTELEVEAMVGNRDIGFIEKNQEVRIKLDSFPFTKYGVLSGKIARVSGDAVNQGNGGDSGNGSNAGANPRNPLRLGAAPVPQTTNLVYPVTIQLDRDTIRVGDTDVRLAPGMTAVVEIKTGRRRVIEYVLSPLKKTVSTAGHER
jgi:hemolysin D